MYNGYVDGLFQRLTCKLAIGVPTSSISTSPHWHLVECLVSAMVPSWSSEGERERDSLFERRLRRGVLAAGKQQSTCPCSAFLRSVFRRTSRKDYAEGRTLRTGVGCMETLLLSVVLERSNNRSTVVTTR